MQGTSKLIVAVIALAMLVAPVQAAAQSPTNDAYDDRSVQTVDPGDPVDPVDPGNTNSEHNSGGSLPFTGTDVALLLAAGGALMVLGFGVRRLTRRPDTA